MYMEGVSLITCYCLLTGDPPILTTSPVYRTLHHPQPVKPKPFGTVELEISHNDDDSDADMSEVCICLNVYFALHSFS